MISIVLVWIYYFYCLEQSIYTLSKDGIRSDEIEAINISECFMFLGMASFMFEGISLVLPAYEAAADKKTYPKILFWAMFATSIILSVVGINYLIYGDDTEELLTLNMKENGILHSLTFCLIIVMVFTFPLQLFPLSTLLEAYCFKDRKSKKITWFKNFHRFMWVGFTAVVAYTLRDKLDKLLSLTGALSGAPLSFILPCWFYLKLMPNLSKSDRFYTMSLGIGGFVIMILTITTTVMNW